MKDTLRLMGWRASGVAGEEEALVEFGWSEKASGTRWRRWHRGWDPPRLLGKTEVWPVLEVGLV